MNVGSCFYFTLPITIAKQILPLKKTSLDPVVATIKSSIKVLVAEDNAVNQSVIRGMLNKLGVDPLIVENGDEVIQYFANSNTAVDIILMDCEMPIMDGWDTSRMIRQKAIRRACGKPVLIIGLSAHAVEGASARALDSGMDDYLTKPLSMNALIAKLQHYELLD
jgi:CheY-like chemotaxis protein